MKTLIDAFKSKRWLSKLPAIVLAIAMLLSIPLCTSEASADDRTVVPALAVCYEQSLVVKSDGTVWAWGTNDRGQLGDGTTADRFTPAQVLGLGDVVAISTGYSHSIALKSDGTVWTWGANDSGQLGDGTTIDRHEPVKVLGLGDVVAISTGYSHSLALKSNGTLWTWGANHKGQLGDGTTADRHEPVQVLGLGDVVAISAGINFSLALKIDGTVWSWGENDSGQLGDGATINRYEPAQVLGLSNVTDISTKYLHSLALKSDGTVWSWGANYRKQIGDGTMIDRHEPVQVPNLRDVVTISAGTTFSLVLKRDSTVWSWGSNTSGQLGYGTAGDDSGVPVRVMGMSDVFSISAGRYSTLALKNNGTVWAWGSNSRGQLGNGTSGPEKAYIPVAIEQLNLGTPQRNIQPKLMLAATPANIQIYPGDITLTAAISGADALLNKAIVFSINNETQLVLTDANGVATYTIENPDVGEYTFGAYYAGNLANLEAYSNDITDYRVENVTTPTDPVEPTPEPPSIFSKPTVWVIIGIAVIATVITALVVRRRREQN